MNEVWKRIFKQYIECYNAIGVLVSNGIVDDEEENELRNTLLDEIISCMKSEVEQ